MPYKDSKSQAAKESRRRSARKYYRFHKKECQARCRKYRQTSGYKIDPYKNNAANLKCRFGITPEQYKHMIYLQNNLCLLCKRPLGQLGLKGDSPVLDHCHNTKVNRGIIHRKCNTAIGMLDDNPVLLRLAAEYLERFQ